MGRRHRGNPDSESSGESSDEDNKSQGGSDEEMDGDDEPQRAVEHESHTTTPAMKTASSTGESALERKRRRVHASASDGDGESGGDSDGSESEEDEEGLEDPDVTDGGWFDMQLLKQMKRPASPVDSEDEGNMPRGAPLGGEESEGEGSDEDDDDFQEVYDFVDEKGRTMYRCRLCPHKGPFRSMNDAEAFMRGKYYLKALKNTIKKAKKDRKQARLDEREPFTKEEVQKFEEKQAAKAEQRAAKLKTRKQRKAAALSEEAIRKKKERFQLKKKRRLERKQEEKGKGATEA